ncbi:MAG: XdhC family protein [Acetobacterium sp.]|nr:XdhC family protein [Bacillota bacterium]MCG2729399.1 XdhC family protein [Acetobacterium sp.]
MKDFFKTVKRAQNNNENFVLATILEKTGSAPRSEGAKMLIKQDLSIEGTIGGGLVEALVIKAAAKIHQDRKFRIEEFMLSNQDAASLGMVCGGDIKILLEYIDWENEKSRGFFEEISNLHDKKSEFVVITKIPQEADKDAELEKWACTETGFYGRESDEILSLIKEIKENFYQLKYKEAYLHAKGFFVEPIFNTENVCILGGGHIGKVLAELCKNLGFYVSVVDDREEFANEKRFNHVDEVVVAHGFENITDYVKINAQSFVIIVTRGHSYDKEVLAQMLMTDAKYIGMIGSSNKRNHVYQCLLEDGFSFIDLDRVYSPIGLPIHADTPEEIAVSIAAEMIKVRRS